MDSVLNARQNKRRQRSIWSGFTFLLLVCFWLLTYFWGTSQVHQYYVKQTRKELPTQKRLYDDQRPLDYSKSWVSITDPWAPLPFVVSVEVDMTGSSLWWQPRRDYFFWCPGYHSKTHFWGRWVTETYEENE